MNSSDEEIKILYLLSGSCNILPSSCVKLRSYLNTHLSNVADQQNLQLLKSFRNRNKMCPYCYSPWSSDTTSFKLLPSKRSRARQTQSKVDEKGKSGSSELNESRNTLVLKCKVCTKKSPFSLVKRKPFEERVRDDNQSSVMVESVKKKKKKKKRDKSCGLALNLIKPEDYSPEVVIIKKKKRMEDTNKTRTLNPSHFEDKLKQLKKNTPIPKTSINKNLVPNPYAGQIQVELTKKKSKKLEILKQAVKEEKSLVKKTLKDFLKLV